MEYIAIVSVVVTILLFLIGVVNARVSKLYSKTVYRETCAATHEGVRDSLKRVVEDVKELRGDVKDMQDKVYQILVEVRKLNTNHRDKW